MPELPEVQTIVNDLIKTVHGCKVIACHVLRNSVISGDPDDFSNRVTGRTIKRIERKGKYIIFSLPPRLWLITHLKMTGKFTIQSNSDGLRKHDRVVFQLDSDNRLVFTDVRCFGRLELVQSLKFHTSLSRLGMDPWDRDLTADWLGNVLKNMKSPIKSVLLNQEIIAGIGNIYASESLFDSKINPLRPAGSLSLSELSRLIESIQKILELALIYNGTSISDYRRVDEKQGSFQNFLKVYGKAGCYCNVCNSKIIKKKLNNRSTFLCPSCQK